MISVSQAVINAMQSIGITPIILLSIENALEDGEIYTTTTHFHDVFARGKTFKANGELTNIAPPAISNTVDKQLYRITMNSAVIQKQARNNYGLSGKNVEILAGFVYNSGGLTSEDDLLVVYRGRVGECSINMNTELIGDNYVEFSCTSPMYSLDFKRGIFLSRDAVRRNNPGDAACDQIFSGSNKLTLKWGRA